MVAVPARVVSGVTVFVPEPFGALTVIDGDAAMFVIVPALVAACAAVNVGTPVVAVTVMAPPPPEPYVIVIVPALWSVTPVTVITWPATARTPVLATE